MDTYLFKSISLIKLKDFFVVQVLNSKLGIALRVSVTSATIPMAKRTIRFELNNFIDISSS